MAMKLKLPIPLTSDSLDSAPEAYDPSEKRPECIYVKGEQAMALPDCGEVTIKYRVKKREQEIEDGKAEFEVKLELFEIVKVKSCDPLPPASSDTDAGAALDKLRAEME